MKRRPDHQRFLAGLVVGLGCTFFILALSPGSMLNPRRKECPHKETVYLGAAVLQVAHRRRLAQVVSAVSRQIARTLTNTIDASWASQLAQVAAELDPRLPNYPSFLGEDSNSSAPDAPFSLHMSSSKWDFSARLPGMHFRADNTSRSVCPEVYLGGNYDRPFFQRGMVAQKECRQAPQFSRVLTILLPATEWPKEFLHSLIQMIRTHYDVPIIALADVEIILIYPNNVHVTKFFNHSDAEALNEAVKLVETPFVLVGESLASFSNQSSLERLVRVLDDLQHVQVAGGAARDTEGHWIHGCLQQHMANYQAKYTMGYYYSKYECMYCDDLLTPFVTRTKLLKTLTFTAALSGQAMYRDWFAKVRDAGHLAVVCPDVMFFLNSHVSMAAEDWLPMAREWLLETVHSFDSNYFHFSCETLNISCNKLMRIVDSYLIPPCCLQHITRKLHRTLEAAEKRNLDYELQAGSVLGAVKFGSLLPWDIDVDIFTECGHHFEWLEIAYIYLYDKDCRLNEYEMGVYFSVVCPRYMIEFVCKATLSTSYLPPEYRNVSTRINFDGRWTKVMSNPGLHSRNRYGFEILRHAQHWRNLPDPEMGAAKGGYDFPGKWKSCRNPTHHSCLDRYPADGNLPIESPFLQP